MTDQIHRKTRKVINAPGEAHELTFSCFRRRKFLSKERTREYFIAAVRKARKVHRFHLWAYVLMPEHVHMIVLPLEEKYDMSAIQKSIKQSVSRKAMEFLRRENPRGLRLLETGQRNQPYAFWKAGGGYDRNVILPDTLQYMVNYIHNNPVRRGVGRRAGGLVLVQLGGVAGEGFGATVPGPGILSLSTVVG
ncbi:MAG: transposase [Gammaproteobacteria bacterium]|nr:transposase [Gammaproteobacteria bacterium]